MTIKGIIFGRKGEGKEEKDELVSPGVPWTDGTIPFTKLPGSRVSSSIGGERL